MRYNNIICIHMQSKTKINTITRSPSQLLMLQIMNDLLQLIVVHVCLRWIFRSAILRETETEFYHGYFYSLYK